MFIVTKAQQSITWNRSIGHSKSDEISLCMYLDNICLSPTHVVIITIQLGAIYVVGVHSEDISYRKTSNISRTLVGNKIVDNSDVVGASPVGTAPTTSSFST